MKWSRKNVSIDRLGGVAERLKAAVLKTVVPMPRDREFESHPHRQSEKEVAGSPSARARQPILGAKLNFLSLFCEAKRQKRAFHYFPCFILIYLLSYTCIEL